MSLESRLRALATRAATEFNTIRTEISGKSDTAHTHDTRYPRQVQLAGNGATAQWVRIAYLNGGNESNGAHITLLVAGQGNFGSSLRATTIVHLGQRGVGNAYSFEAQQEGTAPSPWAWKVKTRADVNAYTVELWALRPAYDAGAAVTITSAWGTTATLMMDSQSSSDPGGTLQSVAQVVRSDDSRLADTGWVNLNLNAGWSPYSDSNWSPPQIRKIGKQVYMRGLVVFTSGSSANLIAYAPPSCRPTQNFMTLVPVNSAPYLLYVLKTGDIYFPGGAGPNANIYCSLNLTYAVDS